MAPLDVRTSLGRQKTMKKEMLRAKLSLAEEYLSALMRIRERLILQGLTDEELILSVAIASLA